MTTRTSAPTTDTPSLNHVLLRGRISAINQPRDLPSGDAVVTMRLVVPRDRPTGHGRPGGVDTIDVACWTPEAQQLVADAGVDAMVEIEGVLRRRFFRAGGGPASRYEVEARQVRPMTGLAPAPRTDDVAPGGPA